MNTPRRRRNPASASRHHPENRAQPRREQPPEPTPAQRGPLQKPATWIAAGAGAAVALIMALVITFTCKGMDAGWQAITGNPLGIADNCRLAATIIAIPVGLITGLIAMWIAPAFFPDD